MTKVPYPRVTEAEYRAMTDTLRAMHSFVAFKTLCYNMGVRKLKPELERNRGKR